MVLAKKHIERLWWPEPGQPAAPSRRAREHAMTQAEFDAPMPHEFWREVVDRVAAEAPDTLLLAEAFWLLEGYFVRTLGMHRVYNSAFMHMLRDEDNAGYRQVIRDTLEFDPEILKRYVNFMTNPDEKTAVEQFGKGDKYFGVATLMATLPGLPMFGHGQVEGFGEKYGMEFRRATLDEQPDQGLVARHEREIFPLLHRRAWFAEAHDFLLYDFVTRRRGGRRGRLRLLERPRARRRSLVVYHNRFASTAGSIRDSAAYARKAATARRRSSGGPWPRARACPTTRRRSSRSATPGPGSSTCARRARSASAACSSTLDAYQGHVFGEFREVADGPAGQWRRSPTSSAGAACRRSTRRSLELPLEPVHAPVAGAVRRRAWRPSWTRGDRRPTSTCSRIGWRPARRGRADDRR